MKAPESVAAGRMPLHLADAAAGTQQMTCAVCAVAQAVEDAFTDTSKMGVRTPGASACPAAWAVVPLPALTPIAHRVRGGLQSSLLLLRNLPASLGKRQPAVAALMTLVQPGARVGVQCHRCGVARGHRAVQGAVFGAGRPDGGAQLLPRHGAPTFYAPLFLLSCDCITVSPLGTTIRLATLNLGHMYPRQGAAPSCDPDAPSRMSCATHALQIGLIAKGDQQTVRSST